VSDLKTREAKLQKTLEDIYSENQFTELKAGEGINFAGGSVTAGFSDAKLGKALRQD
jgi:hypothetical protein